MDILSDDLRARSFRLLDVEKTLSQLTVAQKISILSGSDMLNAWTLHGIRANAGISSAVAHNTRFGIPSYFLMDLTEPVAPNSLKVFVFHYQSLSGLNVGSTQLASRREGVPASCFPVGTGLGASWDHTLLYVVGKTLAVESKAKGAHVQPSTSNVPHSVEGDLRVTARTLFSANHLPACSLKAVNDQEFETYTPSVSQPTCLPGHSEKYISVHSDSRSGHQNPPWAIMTGGSVMSDGNGTYSITESIRAGLDLEVPGPTVVRGAALNAAFRSRKVSEQNIDDKPSGVPEDAPEKSNDDPEVKKILREAASSAVVLLKNEANVLPLDPSVVKSVGVISPNAKNAVISGGGSAALHGCPASSYTVTPFDAIADAARERGINEVQFVLGGTAHKYASVIGWGLRAADARVAGWKLKFPPEATSQASPSSTLQRLPKELEGFTKTAVLQLRGSEDVSIGLDHLAFGFFNDQEDMNRWVAEEDEFKVFVGPTLDDVVQS
ncbi:uncharacterized protein EI90DRAFT_3018914 [Cantharellus anzutake]|uniref:uncharacterized protein n=1 Tax=Cantharellus anzutake TaxID=1750568 RepID=UPI0019079D37|nr:uncharacterized protein EI90DRAFT_3018914 [Cantharellus anzutake]KAF8325857.1 hypothetical protein EI90DRAFT_3018914 [Cantharellus anzutake]